MMALETLARSTSDSLTAPTPCPTTLIATTGSSILPSALRTASRVPWASALTTRLSSLTSPSLARRARSSRVMRGAVSRPASAADVAADEIVAHTQRPGLDEDGRDRPPAALQVGVDHGAESRPLRVGLQLQDLAAEHDRGQQVVEALPVAGGDVDALVLAAVVAGDNVLLRQ